MVSTIFFIDSFILLRYPIVLSIWTQGGVEIFDTVDNDIVTICNHFWFCIIDKSWKIYIFVIFVVFDFS